MMYFWDIFQQILRDMKMRKLRSFLALFGIVWGTIAVVIMFAIGQGFYQQHHQRFQALAQGRIGFYLNQTSKSYQGYPNGRRIIIHADEVGNIQNIIPHIKAITPIISQNTNVSYESQTSSVTVKGVLPNSKAISGIKLAKNSRFIDPLDIKNSRQVVFVGNWIKNKLANQNNILNELILINHVPFRVIGYPKMLGKNNYQQVDYELYIPYTTAIKLWGDVPISSIQLLPTKSKYSKEISRNMMNYLASRYRFSPDDKAAVYIFNTSEFSNMINWIFRGIQLFLAFCGLMTLCVGGVGVANIMFLIVRERTREIGLRMALGARRFHILMQILLESLLIVFLGGLVGLIISLFVIVLLNNCHLPEWLGHPQLSLWLFVLIFIILAIVAVIAGYFPAKKAADMKPVTALAF